MAESIVAVRLTRNLKYKLTYVKIFETYLESASSPDVIELLQILIQTQQVAIAELAGYLRHAGVSTQDMELNDKLLTQANGRSDLRSRLRFIYDGLERAVEWYRMQLVDRQMTADPDLRRLLVELGEMEAAKLWRTEAVMGMLRIPTRGKGKEPEPESAMEQPPQDIWKPRLVDDFGQSRWTGDQPRWQTPQKRKRR
jgi:hypothetical protein